MLHNRKSKWTLKMKMWAHDHLLDSFLFRRRCLSKGIIPGVVNQKLGDWVLAPDLTLTAEWSLATVPESWSRDWKIWLSWHCACAFFHIEWSPTRVAAPTHLPISTQHVSHSLPPSSAAQGKLVWRWHNLYLMMISISINWLKKLEKYLLQEESTGCRQAYDNYDFHRCQQHENVLSSKNCGIVVDVLSWWTECFSWCWHSVCN